MKEYELMPHFILRTPLLSYTQFQERFQGKNLEESSEVLKHFYRDPLLQRAIGLSIPELEQKCKRWLAGTLSNQKEIQQLERSLMRYLIRMSFRATPFGLFASYSLGSWGKTDQVRLAAEQKGLKLRARVSLQKIYPLLQHICNHSEGKKYLKFYPNNTTYTIAEETRYIEFKLGNSASKHSISSVENSTYLQAILSKASQGAYLKDLIQVLVHLDIDPESAAEFIDDLIEANLLTNELIHFAMTGGEVLDVSLEKLQQACKKFNLPTSHFLSLAIVYLEAFKDFQETVESPEPEIGYAKQSEAFSVFPPVSKEHLGPSLQIETLRNIPSCQLNPKMAGKIRRALWAANALSQKQEQENQNIAQFIRAFQERFEGREMPLLLALDEEAGISYPNPSFPKGADDTFVKNIPTGNTPSNINIEWNEIAQFLYRKCQEAKSKQEKEIVITEKEINSFKQSWKNTPDTINVLCSVLEELAPGTPLLRLVVGGGSSAANLLSRFSGMDEKMTQHTQALVDRETDLNPSVILAEISHLSQLNHSNFLLRPSFRKHEIPLISAVSVSQENQILLSDIQISVRNHKIFLRSKRLNKEIRPILSSPHNYLNPALLPIYRFLCDLQFHQKTGWFNFSWNQLHPLFPYLPRVRYENVILSLAEWHFDKKDLAHLLILEGKKLAESILAFRKKWDIPRYIFTFRQGSENELFIDLEQVYLQKIFQEVIRKNIKIKITETFFPKKNNLILDESGHQYANEILISFARKSSTSKVTKEPKSPKHSIVRDFPPGSEWVYFKVYTGLKTADEILSTRIHKLVQKLNQKQLLSHFFFIRYWDPEFHLRIRFKLSDPTKLGRVLKIWNKTMNPLIEKQLVWKIQLDTYKREIERYGAHTMELCEALFTIDSSRIIHFLWLIESEDHAEEQKWLLALVLMEQYLNWFGFSLEEKLIFTQGGFEGFCKEFKADKLTRKAVQSQYKKYQNKITMLLNNEHQLGSAILKTKEWGALRGKNIAHEILRIREAGNLAPNFKELIWSLIHMNAIRIFQGMNRKYELTLYGALAKQYEYEKHKVKQF